MPLVLDATVGGLNSNSYIDLGGAQAIMDATPNSSAWGTNTAAQTQALVYATTMLDALAYDGFKTTVQQALQWPRNGVLDPDYGKTNGGIPGYMVAPGFGVYLDMHAIPKRLQRGCAMLALEILRAGTADVWGVDPTVNIIRKKVDVLETQFTDPYHRRYGLRVYPSVWRQIYPLLECSHPGTVERA